MVHTIDIITKIADTRAEVQHKKLSSYFPREIKNVRLIDVYTIDKYLSRGQLAKVVTALANPITHEAHTNGYVPDWEFDWALEVGFLPGVTDNVATTTREIVEDLLHIKFRRGEGIYTSQIIILSGNMSSRNIYDIADSLYNPIIQRVHIRSATEFRKSPATDRAVPRVTLDTVRKADEVDLHVSDSELILIGKTGITNADGTRRGPLALDLQYLKKIRDYFNTRGRNPTDVELESLAQTWSEHCKHTIFADPLDELKDGLFKTYIKGATDRVRKKRRQRDICVSVFKDNSGAIKFDKEYLITHKVETHNSPSALDPFGGSITGIVGVNRDTIGFGLGAKPIVNVYGFCFADPKDKEPLYKGPGLTQKMLPPRRIMEGVIAGVNSGGNCSGIPTPQGFLYFDKRYKGKPLVFVGTVGMMPREARGRKTYSKKARPADHIVMIGGRVGLDGIHGATFSSEAMDTGSPATAVQIGDPITQKKLSDAIVKEARDLDLFHSITDNGAGGLSCSVAEMAKEAGGCVVQLEKVPLKYPGLAPWQIWISESQERMTLAVPRRKWKKFADLMKRRGVEATVIGTFTKSKKCIVYFRKIKVMDIDMQFLHEGLPTRMLHTTFTKAVHPEPKIPADKSIDHIFRTLLSRPNIASFEFVSMQYDHEVQGTSVIKPLQGRGRVNGEATVVRPLLSSNKGLIISQGLYPSYSDIDTYEMAACSLDTAVRNVVAAGSDPEQIALLDNFCWCSSNEPERLGQLKRAAKACYEYAVSYGTPFISGKDSMFNDFKGYDAKGWPVKISIPPTLLISSLGTIDDVTRVVSIEVKFPGDLIYVLGETADELGGSEFFSFLGGIGNRVPRVDAPRNLKLYKGFHKATERNLVASAISIGRGGLAVALAKMAIAGQWGIEVDVTPTGKTSLREVCALFSESQGRIVVTINPQNRERFEKNLGTCTYTRIGRVTQDPHIIIKGKDRKPLVTISLAEAERVYKKTFAEF